MGVISVKKATILDEKKLRLLKFQQQKKPLCQFSIGGSKLRQLLSCKQSNFRGKGNILEDRSKRPCDRVKIHGEQWIKKPHTNKLRNFALGSAFSEGELNPRQKKKKYPLAPESEDTAASPLWHFRIARISACYLPPSLHLFERKSQLY